jgi:hypothetical protein
LLIEPIQRGTLVADEPDGPEPGVGGVPLFTDTDPKAVAYLVEALRRLTPMEKIERLNALTLRARAMLEADIRRMHPNADAHELRMRFAARWHGPAFARRYLNWDVDIEGY